MTWAMLRAGAGAGGGEGAAGAEDHGRGRAEGRSPGGGVWGGGVGAVLRAGGGVRRPALPDAWGVPAGGQMVVPGAPHPSGLFQKAVMAARDQRLGVAWAHLCSSAGVLALTCVTSVSPAVCDVCGSQRSHWSVCRLSLSVGLSGVPVLWSSRDVCPLLASRGSELHRGDLGRGWRPRFLPTLLPYCRAVLRSPTEVTEDSHLLIDPTNGCSSQDGPVPDPCLETSIQVSDMGGRNHYWPHQGLLAGSRSQEPEVGIKPKHFSILTSRRG